MGSLKENTIRGLQWSMIAQLSRQVWRLVCTAVLSRLLAPAEYGLLSMALIFICFADLFSNLGFGQALVQRQDLEHRHINAVFGLQIALGLLLALLMCALAPAIAHFYREPRLAVIICVLAANYIVLAFRAVPGMLLTREMNFRGLALRDMAADVVAGIAAILMAVSGWGIWSLVGQMLLGSLASTVLVWPMLHEKPRPVLNAPALRELWGFSGGLFGSTVITYWARNADSLLIGKFLGQTELGLYGRAYSLMMLPLTQVSYVVNQVMFPALSQIQHDHEKVRRVYLKALRMLAFITFPMMAGLFVTAEPFIRVLCGKQWLAVIPVFKILCGVGMYQSVGTTVGWILTSQGRTDLMFRLTIMNTVVIVVSVLIGLRWGITGVAGAYAAANVLIWYPLWHITGRIIELRVSTIMKNLMAVLFAALLMACLVWGLDRGLTVRWAAWSRLLVLSGAGVVIYLGLMVSLKKSAFMEWMDLVKISLKIAPRTVAAPDAIAPSDIL